MTTHDDQRAAVIVGPGSPYDRYRWEDGSPLSFTHNGEVHCFVPELSDEEYAEACRKAAEQAERDAEKEREREEANRELGIDPPRTFGEHKRDILSRDKSPEWKRIRLEALADGERRYEEQCAETRKASLAILRSRQAPNRKPARTAAPRASRATSSKSVQRRSSSTRRAAASSPPGSDDPSGSSDPPDRPAANAPEAGARSGARRRLHPHLIVVAVVLGVLSILRRRTPHA